MNRKKLLVVEDDPGLQKQLAWALDDYEVHPAANRDEAITLLRRLQPPVVTLDLGLPPDATGVTEGLATLQQMLALAPSTKVIVLTGHGERAHALRAVALGAYDFQQKPFDGDMLALVAERAFYVHELQMENQRMLQIAGDSPLAGIVSRDPAMLRLCRTIERVAPSSASVMLLGASGCGKEVLARALHQLSGRRLFRFMAINCAAIPENLLESELFGHEKGAFTGAAQQNLGKIELAQGGTFFLDEVGDMALPLQAKLLRFLQERVIERLGGRSEIAVDVRVVCATHQDLIALVKTGRFREDLYYRLTEIVLTIPPLRERVGDSVLLAHHFMHRYCRTEGKPLLSFDDAALAAIAEHGWPGNVRELENCIKRAVILAEGPRIGIGDLGLATAGEAAPLMNLRQVREAAQYRAMAMALAHADGNVAKAAALLGVSRPTLYDLMHYHGIK